MSVYPPKAQQRRHTQKLRVERFRAGFLSQGYFKLTRPGSPHGLSRSGQDVGYASYNPRASSSTSYERVIGSRVCRSRYRGEELGLIE